jgi:mono/diheme cytochrome c family protein
VDGAEQRAAGTRAWDGGRGSGDADEEMLRARAERGLAISPAAVDTRRLSAQERRMVGLGSYIVNAASDCASCHTDQAGFLAGGKPFLLDPQGHLVWSRNLTPDFVTGMQLSFEQFRESMRTGRDFHPLETKVLVAMPWTTYRWASDLDLAAIYAYLRAIPAVGNAVPRDEKRGLPLPAAVSFPGPVYSDGQVARWLRGDQASFDPARGLAISPVEQPAHLRRGRLEAYGVGSYLVNALGRCNDCHTHPDRTASPSRVNVEAFLAGGAVFLVPPALPAAFRQPRVTSANLKGASHGFFHQPGDSFRRFREVIRTGTHADETPPRPLGYPMSLVAGNLPNLLEEDLADLYAYLKAAPATSGPADRPW